MCFEYMLCVYVSFYRICNFESYFFCNRHLSVQIIAENMIFLKIIITEVRIIMFYDVSKDWIYDSKNDFIFKKDYMKIYKDSLHDSDKLADDDKSVCLNSKFLSATFILTNSCSLECK